MESRFELRRQLRQQRRGLTPRQRARAGQALARVIGRSGVFARARRLALFISADGEIDTRPLIGLAWRAGKRVYLPVLAPFGPSRLWFRSYTPHSRLLSNRYGIPEPRRLDCPDLPARHLDLVFAPLVGFDLEGHRLGMGGGYYDRSFAYLNRHRQWQRPRLVGLAYDFQQVERLPNEPWDVPLWGVATETQLRRFDKKREGP